MESWLKIYRNYSSAQLADEIAWLQEQSRNLFVSQTEGNTSYARSTREISDRLEAALQVQNERNGTTPNRALRVDFTDILR